MRVTQRRDADAGQQIDVLAAVRIIETHALAADERHRIALVRLQHEPRFPGNDVVNHNRHRSVLTTSATIRVACPGTTPVAADSSAARSRPSTITTSSTPAASACSHARSLAIMPAVAVPSPTSAATAAPSTVDTVSPLPSSTPGVVPATI